MIFVLSVSQWLAAMAVSERRRDRLLSPPSMVLELPHNVISHVCC
jgi:hypothetical protein